MIEFTKEMIHNAMVNHIEDYTKFMNEVLDMEIVFQIPRQECMDIVIKRYPQLIEN